MEFARFLAFLGSAVACGSLTWLLVRLCYPAEDGLVPSSTALPFDNADDDQWEYELEEEGEDLKLIKPEPIKFFNSDGAEIDPPKIVRENLYGEQPYF